MVKNTRNWWLTVLLNEVFWRSGKGVYLSQQCRDHQMKSPIKMLDTVSLDLEKSGDSYTYMYGPAKIQSLYSSWSRIKQNMDQKQMRSGEERLGECDDESG
jgi:hypothetical protein